MNYRYFICDVFTNQRFGGNQLAVVSDARGLSEKQMQQIAREFNFSETTFVLPAESGNAKRVRIFTPSVEVPFAGHPNIGTAFVLATTGDLPDLEVSNEIVFEEKAGLVPITFHVQSGKSTTIELKAPQNISLGKQVSPEAVASALSLPVSRIVTTTHSPQVASVGLAFLIVELKDQTALENIKINVNAFDEFVRLGASPYLHVYVRSNDDFDIRARVFAPLDGVLEDSATGSANCALIGLLTLRNEQENGDFDWRIAQGVEMGRPSILTARSKKRNGIVESTWIGGNCVMVSEGVLYIE